MEIGEGSGAQQLRTCMQNSVNRSSPSTWTHGVPLQLQALKARKAAHCWSQHAWHRTSLAGVMQLHQPHFMPRKYSRAARAPELRGALSCFCVDVRPSVLRSTAEVCALCECASRCEQMLSDVHWYYLRASAWRVGPAVEHVHGRR